jgi:hypothetical protein
MSYAATPPLISRQGEGAQAAAQPGVGRLPAGLLRNTGLWQQGKVAEDQNIRLGSA